MTSTDQTYDPQDIVEYNPADLANLVRYCVKELMARSVYSLDLPAPFSGAGIYGVFYDGAFSLYQCAAIRSPDASQPIYVGRARFTKSSGARPLYNRLRDHFKSIDVVENLNVEDFTCRFLVLHPLWVSTIEDLLIEHYQSLWNVSIQGFGLHDPGGKRHTGEIPIWDVLHPGRRHYLAMVSRGATGVPLAEVERLVHRYCQMNSPTTDEISLREIDSLPPIPSDDD